MMESKIKAQIKKYNIPSCSISIVKDYEILLQIGPDIDIETQFQAGSISKPIFTLCVLLLVQSGKINLEQDICRYLKKFDRFRNITLKQLLSHTAGINVHGFRGYSKKDKIPTLEQVIQGKGNSDKIYQKYIPELKFIYSGGGFCLAQYVIEKITGMKLDKLAYKLLFKPLGLNCTYKQGKDRKGEYNIYPEQAAAGLWCSSSDLAVIGIEMCKALKNKSKIFDKSTIQNMISPYFKYDSGREQGNTGIGGWILKDYVFGHSGINEGFTSNFVFNKNGSGCIILANTNSDDVWFFFNKIHKICDSAGIDVKYQPAKKNKIPNLKKLTGCYRGLNGNIKIYQPKDYKLWIKFGDNINTMIMPFSNAFTKFYFNYNGLRIMLEFSGKKLKVIQDFEESEFRK